MLELLFYTAIVIVSLILVAQAVFTLGLMLYTWARPERLEESVSPDEYLPPRFSFTAILPARNEEGVIGDTMRQIWQTGYPKELLEMVVVCEQSDAGTIEEAQEAAMEIDHPGVQVISFAAGDRPVNKPRGLNVALGQTKNEVVTIFDSEDDVHPEIFDIINTIMLQKDASIVQAGVQLMNHDTSWYSVQNVLEYFFYFKSRLHFHARVGMIPLGGNTVFMRRRLLEKTAGWDEAALTEDADVGIRLSAVGEKIAVTYDARHTTREETPDSVGGFIKQRTRWCQGFFQVFRKGDWKRLPTRGQRLLAAYTLTYPFFQALFGVLWIPALLMMIYLNVPVGVAIISLLPLYAIGFQFLVGLVGLFEFTRAYQRRLRVREIVRFTLGFLPYQTLLSLSAVRAVYREALGATNWEKTAHSGAHRQPAPAAVTSSSERASETEGAPALAPAPRAERPHRRERAFPATDFERVLEEAKEHFRAERGSVMAQGPGEDVFSIRASRGLPEEVARSAKVGPEEGVVGWVARERAAAVIRNRNTPGELADRLSHPELRSSVVLPVETGDTRVVISLSSESADLNKEALDWLNDRVAELLAKSDNAYRFDRRSVWKEVDVHAG